MSIFVNEQSDYKTAIGVHNRPTNNGPCYFLLWHTTYIPGLKGNNHVRGQIFSPDLKKDRFCKQEWEEFAKSPEIRWVEDHRVLESSSGFVTKWFLEDCERLILARMAHLLPRFTNDYNIIRKLAS